VCPTSLVLADFHAHLSHQEVIGYLGGEWDPISGRLIVKAAFPGVSIIPTDGSTECEMCPISEFQLREQIAARGLSVVGWYHSHPAFPVVPSLCDVQNQANLQLLFRDANNPVVGSRMASRVCVCLVCVCVSFVCVSCIYIYVCVCVCVCVCVVSTHIRAFAWVHSSNRVYCESSARRVFSALEMPSRCDVNSNCFCSDVHLCEPSSLNVPPLSFVSLLVSVRSHLRLPSSDLRRTRSSV
jgi:proteasome lid subunit RPN8/RPN11